MVFRVLQIHVMVILDLLLIHEAHLFYTYTIHVYTHTLWPSHNHKLFLSSFLVNRNLKIYNIWFECGSFMSSSWPKRVKGCTADEDDTPPPWWPARHATCSLGRDQIHLGRRVRDRVCSQGLRQWSEYLRCTGTCKLIDKINGDDNE